MNLSLAPVIAQVPEGRARDIATRIYCSLSTLDEVDAAFVEIRDDIVNVYFILREEDIDLCDSLFEFEEQLIADFGREHLVVHSFTPDLIGAMPSLSEAYSIVDKRRER